MISINPKWCELIASGKKTIEVRKTKPKLEMPFKCYIYCTQGTPAIYSDDKAYMTDSFRVLRRKVMQGAFEQASGMFCWSGKVIGEFVCDRIIEFDAPGGLYRVTPNFIEKECYLSMPELQEYGYNAKTNSYKNLYGWHISDLVIYDKPKELSEFEKPCPLDEECWKCKYYDNGGMYEPPSCNWEDFEISRPPQSWCYVEEVGSCLT